MLLYSSYLPPKDQDASTIRKSVVQAQELHKAATRDWKGLEGTGRDWKGLEGIGGGLHLGPSEKWRFWMVLALFDRSKPSSTIAKQSLAIVNHHEQSVNIVIRR